jgi:transposase
MVDIECIRKLVLRDGWSIRKASRELRVSRQTVRKALESSGPFRYRRREPPRCPAIDPYRGVIRAWLKEDETAPRKQRHTAKRIYTRLVDEYGFAGAESTVRRHVARMRPKPDEMFLPLSADWGQMAQVDWFPAKAFIAGEPQGISVFAMRMRTSRVVFAWASRTEKLEAFLEGHVRAFQWLGGVPRECVYDNPKTAVTKILAGSEREEHERFSSLRAHYLYEGYFCNPAEAHEKGSVENVCGYVRRNALVPVPKVDSLDELNRDLLAWCERDRARLSDLWSREREHLLRLPVHEFDPATVALAHVNRCSLVTYDRNRYSVPRLPKGQQPVAVCAYADQIKVVCGDVVLATHQRLFGRDNEPSFKLEHYLDALERKPRAAMHLAVVPQLPPVYAEARRLLSAGRHDGYKDFAEILLLHREFPAEHVQAALEEAVGKGMPHAQVVRQLALNRSSRPPVPIDVPDHLAALRPHAPELTCYDRLLAGEANGG